VVTTVGWVVSWVMSRGQDVGLILIPGWALLYIAAGGVHDLNIFGRFVFKNVGMLLVAMSLFNLVLYTLAAFIVIRAVRSRKIRRQHQPRSGDI